MTDRKLAFLNWYLSTSEVRILLSPSLSREYRLETGIHVEFRSIDRWLHENEDVWRYRHKGAN